MRLEKMKKFSMKVKSIHLENELVIAAITVYQINSQSIPVLKFDVDIKPDKNANYSLYESLALKKAASLIQQVAEDVAAA
ncbi:hypothetical protein WIC93_18080 [Enterobacter cloacae]|uniref:hypothetical protein n=2 Tax=Enterobacter cloacae complex TaxID=354276 RepID=UPI001F47DE58|nr:hypothetical protein [Enterobacter cloacae]MCK7382151.1 hypothetical protein [Enterobacter cloacae]MDR9973153.1 hypothetical protein [Enterobacter cloacae subsp. cloacae]MDS0087982.1 hypothetical protein [Enterobacter cloacae subsp. cloacae]HBN1092193.1 hypothetical protein [Enterobacter cloacae]